MSLDGKGVVRYGCLFNAQSLISVSVVVILFILFTEFTEYRSKTGNFYERSKCIYCRQEK